MRSRLGTPPYFTWNVPFCQGQLEDIFILTKSAAVCQCVFCNHERMVVCLVPQYPDRICRVALPETPMLSRTLPKREKYPCLRALTQTGISLSQKNNFSTENPARFLRQVSYTGLEFFRKERRQCQTVRIPGATWMTSSSIRKTADQASDKRKPCRNARPQRRFFFIFFLNSESAKAVHAFCDFLFRGCSFEPRFFN